MDDFDSIILPTHANPIVIQWLKSGKAKIMPSGCWEWQTCKDKDGYGVTTSKCKKTSPHRLAINAPKGLLSCHTCDIPSCVNPSHLFIGTHEENQIDKKLKGRARKIGKLPRCACGLAANDGSKECHECRSVRLGKPLCHCGSVVKSRGLCSRHYDQLRAPAKKERKLELKKLRAK